MPKQVDVDKLLKKVGDVAIEQGAQDVIIEALKKQKKSKDAGSGYNSGYLSQQAALE